MSTFGINSFNRPGVLLPVLMGCVAGLHAPMVARADSALNPSVAAPAVVTTKLMAELSAQGIPVTRVRGVDAQGVPILCGTDDSRFAAPSFSGNALPDAALPAGTRGWEAIPCVIRRDGIETFRLEVNVNTNVTAVTFTCPINLIPESGGSQQNLRDDGLGRDRVAGDHIWTSVLMRANTGYPTASYFEYDTNSPAGLFFVDIGTVKIKELSGQTNEFLIYPQVGFLDPAIPLTTPLNLSSNVQVTPHLVNIQGTSQAAQRFLRYLSTDVHMVTTLMYGVVPDAFDFLVFFTTDHLEVLPYTSSANFSAGMHSGSKANYSGTGLSPYDSSSYWGSHGRLLGVTLLDTDRRGAYSANATHELLHQWLLFTDPSLQLDDGTGHYNLRAGTASLLGGSLFLDSTNGGVIIDCGEGLNGAHIAPPLDKYMMGLIDGSAVPPIRIYSSSLGGPYGLCGQFITNIVRTVTIQEIQAVHGVRTPQPAAAQRDFTIGFVIESNGRFLNATELTFYEILARHYTKPLPASQPAPFLGQNWAPITKFFGEGTLWRTYVPSFVRPQIASVTRLPDARLLVAGSGFPKAAYGLESSSDLSTWHSLGSTTAATNGAFQFTNTLTAPVEFYRAVWLE